MYFGFLWDSKEVVAMPPSAVSIAAEVCSVDDE
jgi:hypothetical protein